MFCEMCGQKMGAQDWFCAGCGAAVPADSAAALHPAAHPGGVGPASLAADTGYRPRRPAPRADGASAPLPGLLDLPVRAVRGAAGDGAAVMTGSLVVLMAFAAITAGAIAPSGHRGALIDWFRTAVVLLALSLHASAGVNGGTAVGSDSGAASLAMTLTPLTLTVSVVAAMCLLSRRSERARPSRDLREVAALSAVAALTFAAALAVLVAFSASGPGYDLSSLMTQAVNTSVGAHAWPTLGYGFLLLWLPVMLVRGREYHRRHVALSSRPGEPADRIGYLADLRHVRDLCLGAAMICAAAIAIVALVLSARSHPDVASTDLGSSSPASSTGDEIRALMLVVIGVAAFALNAAVNAVGFCLGGTFGASVNADADGLFGRGLHSPVFGRGVGILAGGVPWWVFLIPVAMAVLSLYLGVRRWYGIAPDASRGPALWRVPLTFAGIWLVLGVLARATVHVSGRGTSLGDFVGQADGKASIGLGLWSLTCSCAFWGLLSTVGGSRLTRPIATMAPLVALILGGSAMSYGWRLLLTDTLLRQGRAIPSALRPVEQALRAGAGLPAPPLTGGRPA